jgi:putative ABC transport system substrate-binding protein
MRRREFIGLLSGAAIAWPYVLKAQRAAKRPLVSVLEGQSSPTAAARAASAFVQGLQELGYIEDRNIDIVYRYADGDLTRMPALADELVRLKPDVFVCSTTPTTLAIRQATATIPIVNYTLTDPEGFGFVASLARPGGQVTGILGTVDGLPGKQLQLALEVLPGATRIGMLLNVTSPGQAVLRRNAEAAAASFGRNFIPVEVRLPDDLVAAFQALARERVDLGLILPDPMFVSERRRIAEFAIAAQLPTMFGFRAYVEAGGLMSYGLNFRESYRRAAVFVDRILKGAQPGDLPVELPTKLELVINLKTAKELGITFRRPSWSKPTR